MRAPRNAYPLRTAAAESALAKQLEAMTEQFEEECAALAKQKDLTARADAHAHEEEDELAGLEKQLAEARAKIAAGVEREAALRVELREAQECEPWAEHVPFS